MSRVNCIKILSVAKRRFHRKFTLPATIYITGNNLHYRQQFTLPATIYITGNNLHYRQQFTLPATMQIIRASF